MSVPEAFGPAFLAPNGDLNSERGQFIGPVPDYSMNARHCRHLTSKHPGAPKPGGKYFSDMDRGRCIQQGTDSTVAVNIADSVKNRLSAVAKGCGWPMMAQPEEPINPAKQRGHMRPCERNCTPHLGRSSCRRSDQEPHRPEDSSRDRQIRASVGAPMDLEIPSWYSL